MSKEDLTYCRNNNDPKNGSCVLPKVQKSLSKILGIKYNENNPSETIQQIHEKLELNGLNIKRRENKWLEKKVP